MVISPSSADVFSAAVVCQNFTLAVYSLGSSQDESARLQRQADELAPVSRALLDRVGLRPGQSAIDLGCGARGVVDLLAERVSPGGQVVGLDADAAHTAMAAEWRGWPARAAGWQPPATAGQRLRPAVNSKVFGETRCTPGGRLGLGPRTRGRLRNRAIRRCGCAMRCCCCCGPVRSRRSFRSQPGPGR
jgi:hypothetical protein